MVSIMSQILLAIMTPVVQVRDVPDPINKKSLGSGLSLKSLGHQIVVGLSMVGPDLL